jgi:hypothetical protein
MPNKSTIIKVKKNSSGDITDVMMGDGTVHSIEEAIDMAKNECIESVNVGKSKNGKEYLRSNPNGIEGDNLDTKPTF